MERILSDSSAWNPLAYASDYGLYNYPRRVRHDNYASRQNADNKKKSKESNRSVKMSWQKGKH